MTNEADPSLLRNDIHIQATYRLTEALVASEKKMRRRIELLSEVIFETASDGNLSFLNQAWANALGYDLKASLGQPLRVFVHEADRQQLDLTLASTTSYGMGVRPQLRLLRNDGGIVWMELSVVPLNEGGVVGTLYDVTEQKRAQAELAKLSLVASFTDNLVVITDGVGRIEWVNQAFIRKTGYSSEEAIGMKPGSLLQGPETDPTTTAMIRERLSEKRSFQCELLNYTKSGEKYWVAIHISPIQNASGEVERFVAIQTDITELRKTQQDLKAAKEAAESASEAKTQFLATISHEMRTPLNVILGTADLALDSESKTEYHHYLRRINENAETLLGLISDLLDVSKIEAGQFEWERIPFHLRSRLQQALAPIAERAARKGLDFQIVFDEKLPQRVIGDPTRFRQIVTNLAENAVKFTDRGFISIEVAVPEAGPSADGMGLGIRVADSGAGIPTSAIPYIFDRFFQGDSSTTRRKGGAGLGLSIVKSLVNAMGGKVAVESMPGEGAQFQVLLPLEPFIEAEKPGGPRAGGQAMGPARLLQNTVNCILVVEDNDDNFAIIHRHLTNNGYRVERAANGKQAVDAVTSQRFDLILMDIEMPEMDGLQATRLIRAGELTGSRTPVPILAVTAHAVRGYRERCLQAGCTGYLTKPVRKEALFDAVTSALAEAQMPKPVPQEDQVPIYVEVDPDLTDLVPGFLDHCRRDVGRILDAVATENWTLAAKIGQRLKGIAPSYGFDEIGRLGKEIEMASNTLYARGIKTAAGKLADHLQQVRVIV